ncbi:MAG: anion transporter [Spirochaetia bacterium]|jgi:Na+/H+ antiporter NhaD/arsenite permease-like protein|nr:anion transporter [Spirochaetia bacterium]
MNLLQAAVYLVIVLAFFGIAVGRLPRLAMNRASIALTAALILILVKGISYKEAFAAIDAETLALLLAMMLIVANLRISGFFGMAGSRLLAMAGSPRSFLALVILSSGLLSALFLNDTICLMLTPLVIEIARRKNRDGRPYLIALAVSANAGSCATPIGNPQNMLIASQSGLGFFDFILFLGPPALFALGLCFIACLLSFPREFSSAAEGASILASDARIPQPGPTPEASDRRLMIKSLVAAGLLLVLLASGLRTSVAALAAASVLLVSRRIKPERVFGQVDFELLVFFSGLFILTAAVAKTPLFSAFMERLGPSLKSPGLAFSGSVTLVSNMVSNVPAVMLLSPLTAGFQNPRTAWLSLAMASTFAGNLTLLGSVANLIVAGQAEKEGLRIGFIDYLKLGLPVTLVSVAAGSFWLQAVVN